MAQSPENLPLDTRLLGNAVIEMNISRRTVSLYPGNHSLVEEALQRAFRILGELFELRAEITLAVAKDTLVVDKYRLDTKNPVFRDFALSLSAMGIATLTFIKGLKVEELFSFQRFLTGGAEDLSADTLPERLKDYNLVHILVKPVDYQEFGFVKDSVDEDGPDEHLLERYIKGILDGTLLPADVAEVVDGLPPEVLARLLSGVDPGKIEEKTYETVITGYLRRSGGPAFSGKDLGKLMTFISKLGPELKRQFLGTSVKALGRDMAALGAALEGVSVDTIIEFLSSLEKNRIVMPDAVRNILSKFSHLGEEASTPAPGEMENLADDIILSGDMLNVLRTEEGRSVMTDSYREEMKKLTEADLTGFRNALGGSFQAEFHEDYVRYSYEQALLEIIAAAPGLADPVEGLVYADILTRLARETVEAGQYGQLYELITAMQGNRDTRRQPEIARAVLENCCTEEFIKELTASFETHGRQARGAVMLLCGYYGERIVPFLYDLLGTAKSAATRKFLIGILVRMGDHVVAESRRRIADRRWYVRRNILYILGESGAAEGVPTLKALARDEDSRVRLEAAKCLVKTGNPEGARILRSLIHDGPKKSSESAIVYAGTDGITEVLPDLVSLLRKQAVSGNDYRLKLIVVRALGQIGSLAAEPPLREILKDHSILYRKQLDKLKAEVEKALENIRRENE